MTSGGLPAATLRDRTAGTVVRAAIGTLLPASARVAAGGSPTVPATGLPAQPATGATPPARAGPGLRRPTRRHGAVEGLPWPCGDLHRDLRQLRRRGRRPRGGAPGVRDPGVVGH